MNIMYFLPSIPLLVLSSSLDGIMDRRFGELPPNTRTHARTHQ